MSLLKTHKSKLFKEYKTSTGELAEGKIPSAENPLLKPPVEVSLDGEESKGAGGYKLNNINSPSVQAVDSSPFILEYGNKYIPGMQFLEANEWKEPVWTVIDYDAETDEWMIFFRRDENFSVYNEFQFEIGDRLGAKWDKERHGWRFPAITYSMKDLLDHIETERKSLMRYNSGPTSYYGQKLRYYRDVQLTEIARLTIEAKRNLEARWEELQKATGVTTDCIDADTENPLLNHQHSGIEFMLSHDALLADDMGTGKTRQMLNVAYKMFADKEIGRAIVICPATAKGVWYNQAKQYFPETILPIKITGVWEERLRRLSAVFPEKKMPLYILNYETARGHPVELQNLMGDGMLILDEVHKIKSPNSKVTQVITALKPLYKKVLTGTPIVNIPLDAYTIFNYIKPGLLGRSYDQFFKHFAYRYGRFKIGWRNLEEFNKRIQPYYIRRLKKDILNLPEKMYVRDYEEIEMGEVQAKVYRDMATKFIAELESMNEGSYIVEANNVVTRVMRLLQICDGYLSRGVGEGIEWISDAAKPKELKEILEDYLKESNGKNNSNNSDRKVIIWSRFLPPLEMLQTELAEYHPVALHGSIPEERRGVGPKDSLDTVVGKFWNDPKCKIFLGQIQTGGQSIDLSCSDLEIFYDQWWSPGMNLQAEDRAHRLGQKKSVTIIPLVTKRTIEQYYFAQEFEYPEGSGKMEKGLLARKKDWIEQAIEGQHTVLPSKSELIEWLRRI